MLRRALPWFESPLVFLRTTGAMESASASLDADADDDWASRYFHVTRGTEHRLGLPWLDARLAICIDIRASFWWSCRQLDGLAARAFRLAGLHPGASIEPAAIVALAEVSDPGPGQARSRDPGPGQPNPDPGPRAVQHEHPAPGVCRGAGRPAPGAGATLTPPPRPG